MDRDELRDLRKLCQVATGLYVFETERGGPLSTDALQRIVKTAGQVAGLEVEAHPHMLRHATGYFLANEGTDTRRSRPRIPTTRRYASSSPRACSARSTRPGRRTRGEQYQM